MTIHPFYVIQIKDFIQFPFKKYSLQRSKVKKKRNKKKKTIFFQFLFALFFYFNVIIIAFLMI